VLELPAVQFAIALALGLLVGLQREWVEQKPLGLRSFTLITLIGALIGLYADEAGLWIIAVGLIAVTLGIFVHSILLAREQAVAGMTTELAGIVMYMVGAMTTTGYPIMAVVLAGIVTLLLHWKAPMHSLTRRIAPEEFQAVARFVLVTLVVLPILPDRTFGPYDVLNPFHTWLMVVLIVGLNLAGYIAMRFSSGRGGALLGGVLGGLVSSTATTVSYATRSRSEPVLVPVAMVVILIASALVYVRILLEVLAVAPSLVFSLAGPVLSFFAMFCLIAAVLMRNAGRGAAREVKTGNPAELSTALVFATIYSVVVFLSAAVSDHFGETMLYPVAVLSGLTDVDAITLSIAHLYQNGRVTADVAWRVVFVASLANLVFKTGVVGFVGGAELRRRLVPLMGILIVTGSVGAVLWPR
jgi:uncharacterized membrane protein (DUF4010 family)